MDHRGALRRGQHDTSPVLARIVAAGHHAVAIGRGWRARGAFPRAGDGVGRVAVGLGYHRVARVEVGDFGAWYLSCMHRGIED